jgi:teichuronic acid biosynthesis glycosyltransferase TuaG
MSGVRPEVTVITPAHDAARFLARTIESVRAQTFADWEMCVVDDGSSDATPEIVETIAREDPRVRLIRRPRAGGPAAARNEGIDRSRGRYVAFLDSDDLWRPEKLAIQLETMRRTGSTFTYTDYSLIDEQDRPLGRKILAPARMTYPELLKNTIIGCLTVMVERRRLGQHRMPDLRQHEDLSLWLDLLRDGGSAEGIPRDLASYRIVRGSASRDKVRAAMHLWSVYRRHEKLGLFDAAWYYAHYAWNAYWKRNR